MLYVCYGAKKSGSTLTAKLTVALLHEAGFPHLSLSAEDRGDETGHGSDTNTVRNWTPDVVEAAIRGVPADYPVAFRTHHRPTAAIAAAVSEGFAKVQICVRDPRDIALSMWDVLHRHRVKGRERGGTSLESMPAMMKHIERNVQHTLGWARLGTPLILGYETTAFAPHETFQAICDDLGLKVPRERFDDLFESVTRTKNAQQNKNVARPHRHRQEMPLADQKLFLERFSEYYERFLPDAVARYDGPAEAPSAAADRPRGTALVIPMRSAPRPATSLATPRAEKPEATATRAGGSFFRGDVLNRHPNRKDLYGGTSIQDHFLKGWMPKEPFIGPETNIVAFGSCFAANIGKYLRGLGFDIATAREGITHVQKISDGLVNVHAICSQFEWAWENRVPSLELWHGWNAEEFGYSEEVRLATRALFDRADVFVLTFGLSEIWYDEPTGEVFWRAVPESKFDPTRHKFRTATQAETVERLRKIYDLIRRHRPNATIVFTLSPVALAATFRSVACITANSVSKATLRSAIDEVHGSTRDDNFFYFPAYEVVTQAFRVPFATDLRHPQIHVITANMKAFERYFCTTGLTDEDLAVTLKEALDIDTVNAGNTRAAREIVLELRNRFKIGSDAKPSTEAKPSREERLAAREARLAKRAKSRDAGSDKDAARLAKIAKKARREGKASGAVEHALPN